MNVQAICLNCNERYSGDGSERMMQWGLCDKPVCREIDALELAALEDGNMHPSVPRLGISCGCDIHEQIRKLRRSLR